MKTVNMKFKGMVLTALISLGSMTAAAGEPANYNVVPLPQSIVMTKGAAFEVDADVQILAPAELQSEAEFLKQYIKELTKCDLTIVNKRAKKVRYIELAVSPTVTAKEGYVLNINQKGVTIQGGTAAGVFYGIQTLRKSLPIA